MRILGIDPGLQITGYGVIDYDRTRPKLIDGGVIRLKPRTSIPDRLVELEIELESLIDEHKPQICAVEQLYSHYKHPRTAILMGHARGVILLAAEQASVPVREYAPAEVKKAIVGRGAALKPQVAQMVRQLLRLASAPEPADASDGVAIALTDLLVASRRNQVAQRTVSR